MARCCCIIKCNINDNRSPSKVPRLVMPEEVFVNIAKMIGTEVNRGLGFLQDVACGRNMKQFLVVLFSYIHSPLVLFCLYDENTRYIIVFLS